MATSKRPKARVESIRQLEARSANPVAPLREAKLLGTGMHAWVKKPEVATALAFMGMTDKVRSTPVLSFPGHAEADVNNSICSC